MTARNNADGTTDEQTNNQLRTDGGQDRSNAGTRPIAQIKMNRSPVDIDDSKPTVKEIVAATGRTPSNFDVFELENEGDTEGTEIPLGRVIDRTESGETLFFRAVEKERNAGR